MIKNREIARNYRSFGKPRGLGYCDNGCSENPFRKLEKSLSFFFFLWIQFTCPQGRVNDFFPRPTSDFLRI